MLHLLMDPNPPMSFRDFLLLLTTSGAALGAVVSFLLALLWGFLAEYVPGNGYQLPENQKRLISIVAPFLAVLVCYGVLVLQGIATVDDESLWAVLYTAFVAVTGKQLTFAMAIAGQQAQAAARRVRNLVTRG
jgi:hypothetical protein